MGGVVAGCLGAALLAQAAERDTDATQMRGHLKDWLGLVIALAIALALSAMIIQAVWL
jgi:hypothetical protein